MRSSWNAGLTKETSSSVKKISDTMRRKGLDNFKRWRDRMKAKGEIKTEYPELKQNGDLAELVGVVLGDGHICKFPRCESLRVTGTSTNVGFVGRYAKLIEHVFHKRPAVIPRKSSNATDITIYEKNISKRLGIPCGARRYHRYRVPRWISSNRGNKIRFLRGLYEAEGSLSFHPGTYTHKFIFSGANEHLLKAVFRLVKSLGFNPHCSKCKIQISRKDEVQKLANLLQFRHYGK